MRIKSKTRIALGDKADGDYSKEEAGPVLDEWFKGKKDLTVEMKSLTDLTGVLKLTYGTAGTDKKVTRDLVVTLEKRKVGGFALVKIELV